MSIECFYSFKVLYYSESDNKELKFKFKIPKYPLESETDFALRTIVYILNYNEDLKFSEAPYDNNSPTLYTKDLHGKYNFIIQIGKPEYKIKNVKIITYTKENFGEDFLNSFFANLTSSNLLVISEIDKAFYFSLNEQEILNQITI